MKAALTSSRPLTPQTYHMLLALVGAERHGYGIKDRIRQDTGGAIRLPGGTLYPALQRLVKVGWLEELTSNQVRYRLTASGEVALRAEHRRLKEAVDVAERRFLAQTYNVSEQLY